MSSKLEKFKLNRDHLLAILMGSQNCYFGGLRTNHSSNTYLVDSFFPNQGKALTFILGCFYDSGRNYNIISSSEQGHVELYDDEGDFDAWSSDLSVDLDNYDEKRILRNRELAYCYLYGAYMKYGSFIKEVKAHSRAYEHSFEFSNSITKYDFIVKIIKALQKRGEPIELLTNSSVVNIPMMSTINFKTNVRIVYDKQVYTSDVFSYKSIIGLKILLQRNYRYSL